MDYEQIIIRRLEAGTLLRGAWTSYKDGKALACLLVTVAPECGKFGYVDNCPAEVMPQWLAYLTPWIDDAGTAEEWEGFVRRFAATSKKWSNLSQRQEYAVRALALRVAAGSARHTDTGFGLTVAEICEQAAKLCDAVANGGSLDENTEVFSRASKMAKQVGYSRSWYALETVAWVKSKEPFATVCALREALSPLTKRAKEEAADRLIDEILTTLEKS